MDDSIKLKQLMSFKEFEGMTVKSVNHDAVNSVYIEFTDGTVADIFAECGSSDTSIPFFDFQS